jgi:hypothetical protein
MTHIGRFFVFKGELSSNEDLRFDYRAGKMAARPQG